MQTKEKPFSHRFQIMAEESFYLFSTVTCLELISCISSFFENRLLLVPNSWHPIPNR